MVGFLVALINGQIKGRMGGSDQRMGRSWGCRVLGFWVAVEGTEQLIEMTLASIFMEGQDG